MSSTPQDTEITLGTGRMLAIFFAFVLVCAFFFAIGFSLGRKTAMAGAVSELRSPAAPPAATIVRPSGGRSEPHPAAPQSDFSFYKAVGEKNANSALSTKDAKAQPSAATSSAVDPNKDSNKPAADTTGSPPPPVTGGYFVQVAAVNRKEDAESLVEALKKKQYPAFIISNTATDKFNHVQVGPYADIKEAEAMRARLVGDGYNPIVKK
jgi:cell division septation protein DedD